MKLKLEAGRGVVVLLVKDDMQLLGAQMDARQAAALEYMKKAEGFAGKCREVSVWHDMEKECTVLFTGVGKGSAEDVRCAVTAAMKWCRRKKQAEAVLALPQLQCECIARAIAEAALMGAYVYNEYVTGKSANCPETVYLDIPESLHAAALEGELLGRADIVSRDLTNEPANVQTPAVLADEVVKLGEEYGFETSVYEEADMEKWGMKALLAVTQGSPLPAKLIVMRYMGDPDSKDILGLIGKGITFDTGGVNLKHNERIITMKHDMAGGACVAGAMCAIASMKLKKNVVAVIAACENVVGSAAYKPGDIIGSMKGKTILVKSTDAEGRLSLIDAMQYAIRYENVTALVDIATLTGAARIIYGEYACPIMGSEDAFTAQLAKAGEQSGERLIHFPLLQEMKEKITGDFCDLCNTARSDSGGMITAALFIQEFTDGLPWIHIDAAGQLWLDRDKDYMSAGGSGFATRSLYYLAKDWKA